MVKMGLMARWYGRWQNINTTLALSINIKPTIRNNRMVSLYNINTRLAPLYNFMTETMMTQDFSNPLVYWSVMGEMMSHFEVALYSHVFFSAIFFFPL